MLDLRVQQGRAPRPLEKAGRVGLGYEQTETETELFLLLTNFKYAARKNITLFSLQVLLESVHVRVLLVLIQRPYLIQRLLIDNVL